MKISGKLMGKWGSFLVSNGTRKIILNEVTQNQKETHDFYSLTSRY